MRIASLLVLAACGADLGPLDVQLDTGVVHGADDAAVRSWLGIPYAAPPVGDLRWQPPRRPAPWDGTRDATMLGQKCPQNTVITPGGGNEDCLYLNVWTQSAMPTKAPVMVWIHGGAFVFGSGGDAFYSGRELARQYGVVVVTINYRLGGLGFLAHPALAAEDAARPTSGNYGILDQLAALEWVQRNIAAFGGDPTNVTLFGESAGGYSTCTHYASQATSTLFAQAIVESGACAGTSLEQTRDKAEADGIALATKLGCPATGAEAIACLRDKSDYEILDATALAPIASQMPGGFFYGEVPGNTLPNIDGTVLPASIETRFAAGDFPARPLIIGTNKDEGTLFHSSILSKPVKDEAEYRAALARRFGDARVDAIVAQYPVASFTSANAALAEVSGDAFFVCPARRNARAISQHAPVWRYSFEQALEQVLIADLGVFHSGEIPFVFGNDAYPLGKVGTTNESLAIASQMQMAWTSFAQTGAPTDLLGWPRYDASEPLFVFDPGPYVPGGTEVRSGYKTAQCDFWDAL